MAVWVATELINLYLYTVVEKLESSSSKKIASSYKHKE